MAKRTSDPGKGMKIQFHLSPEETRLFKDLMQKGGHTKTKLFYINLMTQCALIYQEMEKGRQIGAFNDDLSTIRIFAIPYFPPK